MARPGNQASHHAEKLLPIRHDFNSTDNFEDGVVLSYYTGKAVLGMFEEAVGPQVFRDGVVRYIRKYSRGNAVADDLWAEINAGAEFDLAGGLGAFVNLPGIPLLSVTALGEGRYEFAQSRLQLDARPEASSNWVIPLHYKYLVDDRVVTVALIVDEASELVQLDSEVKWILPNADQRGYYRWSIPDEMLRQLGEDAATHLNVRERMGLLTNLWALLAADKLDGGAYLAAMRGVASDTDPAVIGALLDQLGSVHTTFITPELRAPFAAFVSDMLSPTLARIGTATIPGEDSDITEMRAQVMLWLADYGQDELARSAITSIANQYIAGTIPSSDLAAVALRTNARWGTAETFKAYRDRFEPLLASSPGDRRNYVRAIGSFRDPAVVAEVLDYVLQGKLQAVDITTVIARLAGYEDNIPMLLDWAMHNDARLRELLPGNSMANVPGILTGCSTDNLDSIAEFYGAKERFVAGIEGEIESAFGTARQCAMLRQRELASVRQFLTQPN
jgi:aminopeptidase N